MEYVFASRFICTTLEAAKRVAFHHQVMTNTITLDGDHFNPDGVLTGGARADKSNILMKLTEMQTDMNELDAAKNELIKIEQDLNAENALLSKFNKAKRDYELQESQTKTARIALEQTSLHQITERHAALVAEIDNKNKEIEASKNDIEETNKKVIELEERLKNQDSDKETQKKNAQKKIDETKKFIDKHSKSTSQFQQVN
jgi:structural maintenance of chromosome 2